MANKLPAGLIGNKSIYRTPAVYSSLPLGRIVDSVV